MKWFALFVFLFASLFPVSAENVDYFAVAESMTVKELQALIDEGFDANAALPIETSPLVLASLYSSYDVIVTLIENGAGINMPDPHGVMPIMALAARAEPLGEAELRGLLELVSDVNATDDFGFTALHYAVATGNMDAITILLEAGADPNSVNFEGETPFSYALGSEDEGIIRLLSEHGASIAYLDHELRNELIGDLFGSPIDAERLDFLSLIRYPIDSRDEEGMTLLMHYLMDVSSDAEFVSRLLEMGANPNARTLKGTTPLMIAAAYCTDAGIIGLLIEAGADVNARNEWLFTPLMASMRNPNEEIPKILINAGADVDAQDEDGETALFFAVDGVPNPSVIDVLLEAGADAMILNEHGKKAFETASEDYDVYETDAFWRLVDASF